MKKLLIIQPYLTYYRVPVFEELALGYDTTVICSLPGGDSGFGTEEIIGQKNRFRKFIVPELSWVGKCILHQKGILKVVRKETPDLILCAANPHYISFGLVLLYAKLKKIPVFSWGHGLYKKETPSLFHRVVFLVIAFFSCKYICYTESVKKSLLAIGVCPEKLVVAENSLQNLFPVFAEEKTGKEKGVLFLGRLRSNSGVFDLIDSVQSLRVTTGEDVTVHVVGDGIAATALARAIREKPWVTWYGQVYKQEELTDISRKCFLGCYPGDAGLSVLHYMSLSLPPLTHDNMSCHQGPEPNYIEDGRNGFLFDHGAGRAGLQSSLIRIIRSRRTLAGVQQQAFATYQKITSPSLGKRLLSILQAGC